MTDNLSTKTALKRGILMRCPCCGEGRLMHRYLKAEEACPVCGEDFSRMQADDGPAWLTILIVGHISIPLLLTLEQGGHLEGKWVLPAVIAATVAATLLLLPIAKGVFMSALWLMKRN